MRKPIVFSYDSYRDEFSKIKDDYRAVSRWLHHMKKSKGFSDGLLAYITGYTLGAVQCHLSNLKTEGRKMYDGLNYAAVAVVPEDWTEPEWLNRMLQSHTVAELCKIVGEDENLVRRTIKKHGIKCRKKRPVHPYNNKQWFADNAGATAKQLADLAKVSMFTIHSWKVKHGIISEPQWVEALKHVLKKHAPCRTVAYVAKHDCVKILFTDNSCEYVGVRPKEEVEDFSVRCGYNQILPHDIVIKHLPVITTQYEDHFDLQYNPIAVRGVPRSATEIEKLIARHTFLRAYYQRCSCDGFINHPRHVLDASKDRLRLLFDNIKIKQKFGRLQFGGFENQCRRILEYYIDYFGLAGAHCSADVAATACKAIPIDKLNTTRFIRQLSSYFTSAINPIFLAKVWSDLGISGRVLDLWPHNGSKALACWLLDLEYCTAPNYIMDAAKDRGFFDYIGLKHSTFDGERVGLVVAETRSRQDYEEKHFRFGQYADHTMIVCTDTELERIRPRYDIKSVIPIATSVMASTDLHNPNIVIL